MKELKQYIEESLLDDFDTLSDNQDKMFKDPFAYLFYNSAISNDWEGSLKKFEEVIKLNSKEDHGNLSCYYDVYQKSPIKKGQVQVWMAKVPSFYHKDKIILLFSDADLKPLKDNGSMGEHSYTISLRADDKKNGQPLIEIASGFPYIGSVRKRYILSKELSESAINMVKLIAKGEWENYWKKL
jgi:hypothetical protein